MKLIVYLLVMQVSSLVAGSLWLSHWIDDSRLKEMKDTLDTQTDVIEGLVQAKDGALVFDRSSVVAEELDSERRVFFVLTGVDRTPLAQSNGPLAPIRKDLLEAMQSLEVVDEVVRDITVASGLWLVQSEAIHRKSNGKELIGIVHVAMYAQGSIDDGAAFKRYFLLAALGTLVLTGLGTGIVVSVSTRNLRAFALWLRQTRLSNVGNAFNLVAHSAEETLLFDSFAAMAVTTRKTLESQRLFVAHASHELKTPIAAAKAALQVTLSRPRLAAEYEGVCRDVYQEVETLERLSKTLLELARLDAGAADAGATCELRTVVERVLDRWRKPAELKAITLSAAFSADELTARGDSTSWEVIVGNLVDNAVKYGRRGGFVRVEVAAERNQVVLSVSDDGCGMSKADLLRLGELFYRVDEARVAGSFGLGFAHAKRLVEQLGGTLAVDSELAAGTTVRVVAPM